MIKEIFTPYITIKGRRIYHPTGGVYHFFVEESTTKESDAETDSNKKAV